MYFINALLILSCVCFLSGIVKSQNEDDLRDECDLNDDEFGKCTPFPDCPEVTSKIPQKLPVFCENNGAGGPPRVCCPVANKKSTISQRIFVYEPSEEERQSKSYKKCQEWSELAYVWKRTTLVPGSPVEKVANCAFKVKPLIVGGEPAQPKEFPHMVIFGYVGDNRTSWECGGSLISEQYVLTAKHCLFSRVMKTPPSLAHIGFVNFLHQNESGALQVFHINSTTGIIKHPKSNQTNYNDIALIKLSKAVEFSEYVRPACLHFEKEFPTMSGIATGWGNVAYRDQKNSDTLLKVKLPFVSHNECFNAYKLARNRNLMNGIDESTQFCAGDFTSNKDACQGDSGGPLQIYRTDIYCTYDIVGVTSFGIDCGKQPGVYTRVSHYRTWIESVVWPTD